MVSADAERFTYCFWGIAVFLDLVIKNTAEHDVLVDNVLFALIEMNDVNRCIEIASAVREKRFA